MRKLDTFLETLVIAVILLALAHLFAEDWAALAAWDVAVRRLIVWAGLGIDLFFTIEFFTRLYLALSSGQTGRYFFRERGWVDLLASIPLLLFNSVPNTLALLAGAGLVSGLGGFLNVLKVIKAVRIARILRLLRVVKLFRRIRYVRSPMAQLHVSTITTISVSVLVLCLLAASVLGGLGVFGGAGENLGDRQARYAGYVAAAGSDRTAIARRAMAVAPLEPTLLVARPTGGPAAWSRFDDAYYTAHFLPGDYGYLSANGVEVFVDERPIAASSAREGIVFFAAILLTVLAFLFLYSPRFALWVTDPIHVMKRGMSERDYNLEVKIPPGHGEDDVFALARLYNAVFLPLKDREGAGASGETTALGMEDIRDIMGKG